MAIDHVIRSKVKGKTLKVRLTPIRAIRLQCLECMGFQPSHVPGCSDPLCSLFPFRMGKTGKTYPGRQGVQPEQLKNTSRKAK
jgi:hypothetical protein